MQTRWMNRRNKATGVDERFYPVTHKDAIVDLNSAGEDLGLVKSGGDATIIDGVITVNDDSHNHVISNIDGLQSILDDKLNVTDTAVSALTLKGLTATINELNILDGVTATATELNYMDGVTSNVQTQLNGKSNSDHIHTAEDVGAIPIIDARSADYDMDTVIKSGAHYAFYKVNGDTKNTPYAKGKTTVLQALILSYGTYTTWGFQIAFPVGGSVKAMLWRTNSEGVISDWNTGFLPLTGGKDNPVTNSIYFMGGQGAVSAGDTGAQIYSFPNAADTTNGCFLAITDKNNLNQSVRFVNRVNGEETIYYLYGQHNKPTMSDISGTLSVAKGGTGATTFTSGAALIGAGTGAVTTRGITNNTSYASGISGSTNLITLNTLRYALNRDTGCSAADTNYTTYMARAIAANTTAMTAGTSSLTNGLIYLQYE